MNESCSNLHSATALSGLSSTAETLDPKDNIGDFQILIPTLLPFTRKDSNQDENINRQRLNDTRHNFEQSTTMYVELTWKFWSPKLNLVNRLLDFTRRLLVKLKCLFSHSIFGVITSLKYETSYKWSKLYKNAIKATIGAKVLSHSAHSPHMPQIWALIAPDDLIFGQEHREIFDVSSKIFIQTNQRSTDKSSLPDASRSRTTRSTTSLLRLQTLASLSSY